MTAPAFRIYAVPDVFYPDGTVQRGQISVTVFRLLERRAAVWQAASRMLAAADGESRFFTRDELLHWDWLNAELNELDARIKRITS